MSLQTVRYSKAFLIPVTYSLLASVALLSRWILIRWRSTGMRSNRRDILPRQRVVRWWLAVLWICLRCLRCRHRCCIKSEKDTVNINWIVRTIFLVDIFCRNVSRCYRFPVVACQCMKQMAYKIPSMKPIKTVSPWIAMEFIFQTVSILLNSLDS